MSKPMTKAESEFRYWRDHEKRFHPKSRNVRYSKTQMNRARRRYSRELEKQEALFLEVAIQDEIDYQEEYG